MRRHHRRRRHLPAVVPWTAAVAAALAVVYVVAWLALPQRQPSAPAVVPGNADDASGQGTRSEETMAEDALPSARTAPGSVPSHSTGSGDSGDSGALAGPADAADHWQRVLTRLDRQRSTAWRTGRPAGLRLVWTATSSGLRQDRDMLKAYAARGLAVTGVSLRFERLRVVRAGHDVAVLDAVDRLGTARVRRLDAPSGSGSRRLPADRRTHHRITLALTEQGWRISEVREL